MPAKFVRKLNIGWSLMRWEYEGAPLELHGPNVEAIVRDGELEIEYDSPYDGLQTIYIPVAAMRALLEGLDES